LHRDLGSMASRVSISALRRAIVQLGLGNGRVEQRCNDAR
jgi:hypothetical protein